MGSKNINAAKLFAITGIVLDFIISGFFLIFIVGFTWSWAQLFTSNVDVILEIVKMTKIFFLMIFIDFTQITELAVIFFIFYIKSEYFDRF